MKHLKILMAATALLLVTACNPDVELCYDSHPHRAYIDFVYDWSATNGAPPEVKEMTVIAYRRINTLKYKMMVTPKASNNTGYILFPESEIHYVDLEEEEPTDDPSSADELEEGEGTGENAGEDENGGNEDAGEKETETDDEPVEAGKRRAGETGNGDTQPHRETSLWLRNGEYELLTYNGVPAILNENLNNFLTSNEVEMDTIKLSYRTCKSVDQDPSLEAFHNWIDSNPYSGFILDANQPLYSTKTTLTVPVAHDGTHVECRFQPTVRSQKVNVIFNIDPKEEGIVIDYVHAEMSGIGSRLTLGTGAVSIDQTYKALFAPDLYISTGATVPITDPEDTRRGGALAVKGSFYATGIARSASQSRAIGPGILQLNVHAHITEEVQNEKGETRTHTYARTFRALINLYHTLKQTPSLKYDAEIDGFVQTEPEITLRVRSVLQITRDKVLSGAGSGLDYWIDAGTIHLDI